MHEASTWEKIVAANPAHSMMYAERFRKMEREGRDILGEARAVDAMAERGSRILDAGCGPARLTGYLHAQGHSMVGIDIDPFLINVAQTEHPGPTYLVGDLADFDLPARGIDEPFDVIYCVGNVMTFLAPSTRVMALERMRAHLREGGRIIIGFGAGRGYDFADFRHDAEQAGLRVQAEYSSWTLQPMLPDSTWLVAVLTA